MLNKKRMPRLTSVACQTRGPQLAEHDTNGTRALNPGAARKAIVPTSSEYYTDLRTQVEALSAEFLSHLASATAGDDAPFSSVPPSSARRQSAQRHVRAPRGAARCHRKYGQAW